MMAKNIIICSLVAAVIVLTFGLWEVTNRPPKVKTVVKKERQFTIKRFRVEPTLRTCLEVLTPKNSRVNKLRWWERQEIAAVAATLTKSDNLTQFYILLSNQVKFMEPCPKVGEKECIQRVELMRMSINRYLKRMMKADGQTLEIQRGEGYLHYVASLTVYDNNLKKLHAFIGKQVHKLKDCITPPWRKPSNDPECAQLLSKSSLAIDSYFKKMVIDHGGPLIDRNWNKG